MSLTHQELSDFNSFATEKLNNGGADSMQHLLDLWRSRREYEETVADVREGLADVEAGRVKPVHQAFADIRKSLGWDE